MPKTRRKFTPFYRDALEILVRKRTDIIKRKILAVFDDKKLIYSFRDMHSVIGGATDEALLAWNELRRSGEIVKCAVGWSRPGMMKHVNDLVARGVYAAKLRNGVGEAIVRQYIGDGMTTITKLEARNGGKP